jgi:hypothetical protein
MDCSICLSPVKKELAQVRLGCSHEFHLSCIMKWLHENPTCPCCRKVVSDYPNQESRNSIDPVWIVTREVPVLMLPPRILRISSV